MGIKLCLRSDTVTQELCKQIQIILDPPTPNGASQRFSHFNSFTDFYRPQRSWGKVQACVILFTGLGGWCCPSMHCRWYPSMPISGGSAPEEDLLTGGLLPGGALWRHPPGRLLLRAVRILLEGILVVIEPNYAIALVIVASLFEVDQCR